MSIENQKHYLERNINQTYIDICNKIRNSFGVFLSDYKNKEELKIYIEKVLKKEMKKFNTGYYTSKQLLNSIKRDNGQRYFDHILQALDVYIEEFFKIEYIENLDEEKVFFLIKEQIDRIITIIHHDTVEDTDISLNTIKELFGKKVALGVDIVSKPPFYNFIENIEDKKILEGLQKKGFLNEKFLLSSDLNLKLRLEKETKMSKADKLLSFGDLDFELTKEEKEAIKVFKNLKEKYKPKVNEEYYARFKSLESLLRYAKKRNTELGFGLNDEDLEKVLKNALYAKICDRCDNIKNILKEWKNSTQRIKKKLEETEEKLYLIIQEFDKKYEENTYELLEKIVEVEKKKLQELLSTTTNEVIDETKVETSKTLKKY